ncbi:MAG: hypothetical protein KA264_03465 [Crocinitomicaceae bacterium]|nr:hypothetical protein [Crocinitomicaceae bacterium]
MPIQKLREITGHAAAVYSVDFFNHNIYTGSGDKFVTRWDIHSGNQDQFAIKAESSVYKIKVIPFKNQLIIGTSTGDFHVIDLMDKKEIHFFKQHKLAIFEIAFLESKKLVFISDAEGNVSVWSLENWKLIIYLPFDCGKIRSIIFSKDNEKAYLACQDGKIRIVSTSTFNLIDSFEAHSMGCNVLVFHPLKGHVLFSAGKDGFLRCWDLLNQKQVIAIPAHNFGIYGLHLLNNNSNLISISRDKSIKNWDINTLNPVCKIERKQGGHSHAVNGIVGVDDSTFVTVGDDKRILFWSLLSQLSLN